MQANLFMGSQYELDAARQTEITAVIRLPEDEYRELLREGSLPDGYGDILKKYTSVETNRGMIDRYKAALALTEYGTDGVAVCGSQGYVSYAGHFPNAQDWLDRQIKWMADRVVDLCRNVEHGDAEQPMKLPFSKIRRVTETDITSDNGIGELLLAELKEREEIADVILQEDCFEINLALDYGQEALDTPGEWMNLAGLIGCNLHDVHLLHDSEEHDLATIVDLTPDTLTEQGKKDWADVLAAKVENISHGYYGTQIDLSGVEADRLHDFSYMLAGQCPVSDYDKWVDDGIRQSPAMLEAEAGFIEAMRKIQGIDEGKTPEWLDHAWTLAVKFSGDSGIPCDEAYPAVLKEFAAAFADVDRHFETCAYEIYNYRAAYMPQQLMKVADYICEGGGAEDAYELARQGCDFQELAVPDDPNEDESQGMTMG